MKPITDKEFRKLAEYIKANYGVNLFQKKALVVGRLQNYITQSNFGSFSDYYGYIESDKTGKAAATLINRVTTNHTFFMREPEHFEYFKNTVLPGLVTREYARKDLRIWSAGCSTGEEAYTLAMVIADHFGADKGRWDTKILATDISTRALEKAVEGEYPNEGLESLPEKWRRDYFTRLSDEKSIIADKIKSEVIFRKFNLMEEVFPFRKKFHVIFCRNVMIYFDSKARKELADKFYEFMESGGYLFIGHSESLNREETKFKHVLPAVYRKD